jgi:IclR family pca regulon transcriptional regulator
VTLKTKTRSEDLLTEIRRVRTAGYAIADKEVDLGSRSVAVPVVTSIGSVPAAISISFPSGREPMQALVDATLPVLRAASASLGCLL